MAVACRSSGLQKSKNFVPPVLCRLVRLNHVFKASCPSFLCSTEARAVRDMASAVEKRAPITSLYLILLRGGFGDHSL